MLDEVKFFTDDRLLYDVPLVPTAVLSVKFLSFETDFVSVFYADGLFVSETVLFFTYVVFDWFIEDLLVFSFSFWSLPEFFTDDGDFWSPKPGLPSTLETSGFNGWATAGDADCPAPQPIEWLILLVTKIYKSQEFLND